MNSTPHRQLAQNCASPSWNSYNIINCDYFLIFREVWHSSGRTPTLAQLYRIPIVRLLPHSYIPVPCINTHRSALQPCDSTGAMHRVHARHGHHGALQIIGITVLVNLTQHDQVTVVAKSLIWLRAQATVTIWKWKTITRGSQICSRPVDSNHKKGNYDTWSQCSK